MPVVTWLDWNDEAFARADAEQKPVLLAIGATWCSSCAEMDRTSYADPHDRFHHQPAFHPHQSGRRSSSRHQRTV